MLTTAKTRLDVLSCLEKDVTHAHVLLGTVIDRLLMLLSESIPNGKQGLFQGNLTRRFINISFIDSYSNNCFTVIFKKRGGRKQFNFPTLSTSIKLKYSGHHDSPTI